MCYTRFVFFTLFSIIAISVTCPQLAAQSPLTLMPAKPMAGKEIVITYTPAKTQLNAAPDIAGNAYLMEGTMPIVKEIRLIRSGNFYMGRFSTNDTTRAVCFSFVSGDLRDNNINEEGYYSFLYDAGGEVIPGSREEVARALNGIGSIWNLKKNAEAASKLNTEELQADDSLRSRSPFRYIKLLQGSDLPNRNELITSLLDTIVASPATGEADLAAASTFYLETLKNKELSARADSILKQRFPSGNWVRTELFSKMQRENDPVKKDSFYTKYYQLYPPSDKQERETAMLYAYSVALAYSETDANRALYWIRNNTDLTQKGTINYIVAYMQSGLATEGKTGDIATGLRCAEIAMTCIDSLLITGGGKASYRTQDEHRKNLRAIRNTYLEPYAVLLFHSGNTAKAVSIQTELVKLSEGGNIIQNQNLALFTGKQYGDDSAKKLISRFLISGKSTPAMTEQLKEIYKRSPGTDSSGWDNYLDSLKTKETDSKRTALKSRMVNQAAPAFVLRNLEGKQVSLESMKGKIVVADFWATWCAPCKVTFPAMKIAVEKYKNDPEVAFVFIDTWERAEIAETKTAVAGYLQENKYPFDVLFDSDGRTVEAYQVQGIPTKFVIDKNGQIRFRSGGFEGTNESFVTEIDLMIEIVR